MTPGVWLCEYRENSIISQEVDVRNYEMLGNTGQSLAGGGAGDSKVSSSRLCMEHLGHFGQTRGTAAKGVGLHVVGLGEI